MKALIKDILRRVDALSDDDQIELEFELSRRLNRRWIVATKEARKIAKAKGITQDVIDQMIERRRYGSSEHRRI